MAKSVDEYIALHPETVQKVLERVRTVIRNALPEAEEVISYKIPAYKLHGSIVLYFAGWSKHYSLYPATDSLIATFEGELAPYLYKRTIRFPLSRPVPVKLIARIARFQAREAVQRKKAKPTTPKRR
ncbi:MAG TPA: DUF1801 domain-containing protein [Chthoniobacterales bacterium]|nr:DUF1801 domain-containing protein [Chthoniobacterales bacterium]